MTKEINIELKGEVSELIAAIRQQEQVSAILRMLIKDSNVCDGITPLPVQECNEYGIDMYGDLSLLLGMFREKCNDRRAI